MSVLEMPLGDSVSGVLISAEQDDYIVVPDDAPPTRKCAIICHEVGHMLLGHAAQPNAQSIVDSGLLDAFDPELIRFVIATRDGYEHPEEENAEIVATYLSAELDRRIQRGGYTYYDERWR